VKDKLIDAVKRNLIYMSVMISLGAIVLVFLIVKKYLSIFDVPEFIISLANS